MKKIKKYISICRGLLGLIEGLKFKLFMAVVAGSLGHTMASLIPSIGAYGLVKISRGPYPYKKLIVLIIVFAIVRSLLRYVEQLLNHDVAFKTLALIRDKVFRKMRQLSCAIMERKDSGEMISIITSDIELVEVFYAHTISPVLIALVHTSVMALILGHYSYKYSLGLMGAHLVMGLIIPIITSNRSKDIGKSQRENLSQLNSSILDTFRGIDECMQFSFQETRKKELIDHSRTLAKSSYKLSQVSGENLTISNSTIVIFNIGFTLLGAYLYRQGQVGLEGLIVPLVLFMSSFGPVSALSSLANNLITTMACGERILNLLDEKPQTAIISQGQDVLMEDLEFDGVDFSYEQDNLILKDQDFYIKKGEIVGIKGHSGCGKSTMLKLIMRFYDVDKGSIKINGHDIRNINSKSLNENISYVSQDTHIFKATIEENLLIAKEDASKEEIIMACEKASIHDFISGLDKGYQTYLGQGKELSTGQKQRISIARSFLRDSNLFLLDEPTANIDALNEGLILKSVWDQAKDKAVIISSHKESTLRISDRVIELDRKNNDSNKVN